MNFSERVTNVHESETLKFTTIIAELRKQGKKVIDFAVGEPLFDTPKEIVDATIKALENKKTRYSPISGLPELKEEISTSLNENNLSYGKENITITNGAKQALYSVFQVLCNPGDEVILPKPYWVTFPEQIRLASANPVIVDTFEHKLDLEKIKESITDKTRAIIVNSPHNPTGVVYPEEQLKEVVEIASEKNIFLISDEAYDWLVYDGLKPQTTAALFPEHKKNIITIKSFSKDFSMTGFRIGYIAAEKEFIGMVNKLQSHLTGNVCTFAQYGAISAMKTGKKIIEKYITEMEEKRNLAYKLTTKHFECIKPQGAFYMFPEVKDRFNGDIKNSVDFAALILEKAGVAVVPGDFFGSDDNVRISYALSDEDIKEGFENISKLI